MIRLAAPAKVNLSLRVVARRNDGYHELITRMQKLDLCDWLEIELAGKDIVLTCSDHRLPLDESNLAVRAARKFFSAGRVGMTCGVKLHLEKRIPIAAGLGGGSSDAAVVLKGLNRLLELPFSQEELIELGRPLGADVAFFVSDAPAVCASGIGDKLVPVSPVDGFVYILVNPGFSVSTKWVYENYRATNRLTKKVNESKLCGSQNSVAETFTAEELHNDLEQITEAHYPVVGQIRKSLIDFGAAGALMSGSGPTVFGLFAEQQDLDALLKGLRQAFAEPDGYRVFLTRAFTGV